MKRIALALFVSALFVTTASGAKYPFFQETLRGGIHQDADAKWEDQAEQMTSIDCGKFSPPKQPREDLSDCLGAAVHLKSHSKLVMECVMRMERDRPDDSGRTRIETRGLIGPGEERWGAHSYGPNGLHIVGFSSHCVTLPHEPASALDIPSHCRADVTSPVEDYPIGLRRNRLEGRAIVEYTVTKSGRMSDVKVVGSSGSALVDDTALKSTDRLKVTTTCLGQRFRHTVTFRLSDAPPMDEPRVVE